METRTFRIMVLMGLLMSSLALAPILHAQGPPTAQPGFLGAQPPQLPAAQTEPPPALVSAEQEPNDRFSQPNSIAPSGAVGATITPKGDNDWYQVTFPWPGVLDVVIPGLPADGAADGIAIRLFDDNGDVMYDWAGPPRKGEATMPIWDIPKAGVYYFQVAENYNDAEATYSLQTTFTPAPDSLEPNDTFSKAVLIQPNAPVQAYIFPKNDSDWYAFDMPGRAKLHVLVSNVPKETDIVIRIFNADAGVIYDWYGPAHPGDNTENTYDFQEPGRYYLQVNDSYNDARSTTAYTLSFDITTAVDPLEKSDRFIDALPIAANVETTESIFPRNDSDFFRLSVPSRGELQVSITNYPPNMDMVGRVYDADKNVVCDWQGPPRVGADTNFTCDLGVAGDYVIQVADSYNDAWDLGPYHLKYSFVSKP